MLIDRLYYYLRAFLQIFITFSYKFISAVQALFDDNITINFLTKFNIYLMRCVVFINNIYDFIIIFLGILLREV